MDAFEFGQLVVDLVGDANGSAGGCGNATFRGDILRVSVCEDDAGTDTCVGKNVD